MGCSTSRSSNSTILLGKNRNQLGIASTDIDNRSADSQAGSAFGKLFHDFQTATFTVGQSFSTSFFAFAMLMSAADVQARVRSLSEFPYVAVDAQPGDELQWVFDLWCQLVTAAQDEHLAHAEASSYNVVQECWTASERVSQPRVTECLRRAGAVLAQPRLPDTKLLAKLDSIGAFRLVS